MFNNNNTAGQSPFQFNLDMDAALKNNLGGNGIKTSGIFKVKVENITVENKNGNWISAVSIETTHILKEGNWEVSRGNGIIWNMPLAPKTVNGKDVSFKYRPFMELLAILGVKTGATTQAKVGKNKDKDATIFSEVKPGAEVIMVLQRVLDVDMNNKPKMDIELLKTFLADGRSIAEAKENKAAEEINNVGNIEDRITEARKILDSQETAPTNTDILSGAAAQTTGIEGELFGGQAPATQAAPAQEGNTDGIPTGLFG